MLEETMRGRAEKSESLLSELSTYNSIAIENIQKYETSAFENPKNLHNDQFEPTNVGVTWKRNRNNNPEDRSDANVDVLQGGPLEESLSIGHNQWFRLQFTIPDSMKNRSVLLNFEAVPASITDPDPLGNTIRTEALCYRDSEPWKAFDNAHEELQLTPSAQGGEQFDLYIEVGTTTSWGKLQADEFELKAAQVIAKRETVTELYRNYKLLNDLRKDIDSESPNRKKILRGLFEASELFDFQASTEQELEDTGSEALDRLEELKSNLSSSLSEYSLKTFGHAHIDLAWLWPWTEAVRKGTRSFSNILTLMDDYPELTFVQSQPILYEWIKNQHPSVFERIKDRVEEGRWKPTGALFVESDSNIPSGESLARQYLYGKRYFREEFDVDPKITFLPDTFGYSASLPGIAQAADTPYFFTQKMRFNEVNEFPHDTFRWRGINGAEILAHFPPVETYNGKLNVEETRRSITDFDENDRIDESAYPVGLGDGGGGVTREMLENSRILNSIGSMPDIEFGSLTDYFEYIEKQDPPLETWDGELYLEKHRGTLTTQSTTKRNNRKGEFALRGAEIWSTVALTSDESEFEYGHDSLERGWKVLLFNQFHDILPGSSISDVYVDAGREYEDVFDVATTEYKRATDSLFEKCDESDHIAITNSLSWTRDEFVEVDATNVDVGEDSNLVVYDNDGSKPRPVQSLDGGEAYLFEATDLPSVGAKTYEIREGNTDQSGDNLSVDEQIMENSSLKVSLDDEGYISVYDKELDRALFDGPGNRLMIYQDLPAKHDAWDIEQDLYENGEQLPAPVETDIVERGPNRVKIRQRREFGQSEIIQSISLERGSKRIDFDTQIDWQEEEKCLKTHFPVSAHTNEATYDIQFGHLTRPTHNNTSWDEAQFEEPHQKWVDISASDFGVSVLNDGKYGVHVERSEASLTLLRAPKWPDEEADVGVHEFSYAIYPHAGDIQEAEIMNKGYEFNVPTNVHPVAEPNLISLLSIDGEGVILEAVKQAEDRKDAIVVRLYESWGRPTSITLEPNFSVDSARRLNLIEDDKEGLALENGNLDLSFDPFEIKTVMLDFTS